MLDFMLEETEYWPPEECSEQEITTALNHFFEDFRKRYTRIVNGRKGKKRIKLLSNEDDRHIGVATTLSEKIPFIAVTVQKWKREHLNPFQTEDTVKTCHFDPDVVAETLNSMESDRDVEAIAYYLIKNHITDIEACGIKDSRLADTIDIPEDALAGLSYDNEKLVEQDEEKVRFMSRLYSLYQYIRKRLLTSPDLPEIDKMK